MSYRYPHCTACDYKEEFDQDYRRFDRALRRFLSSTTPLVTSLPVYSHPSRWREEWPDAKPGKVIRLPLVYG